MCVYSVFLIPVPVLQGQDPFTATKTSGLKYFQKSVFEDVLMGAIS